MAWGAAEVTPATGLPVPDLWAVARETVRAGRLGALVWGQAEVGAETRLEDAAARLVYAADVAGIRTASVVWTHAGRGPQSLATLDCWDGLTLVVLGGSGSAHAPRMTLRGTAGTLLWDADGLALASGTPLRAPVTLVEAGSAPWASAWSGPLNDSAAGVAMAAADALREARSAGRLVALFA